MSTIPTNNDLANAIRFLSLDAIQKSNSGHPGMPMGMADIAKTLWINHFKHNPKNPKWRNRDRFILSNGHGSMLLYSLLHLSGYSLSIDDLKEFRKLDSVTPGHPEYGITEGVETTTGPLGQGLANAVGIAIAEKILASKFNKDDILIIDHYTYVFVGDGCLMEGISHECSSLAGVFKLNKLIVFWDDNGISIDGNVKKWFSEDIYKRFSSYGWNVIKDVDGHNHSQINNAIIIAKNEKNKPSLICCKTIIGFGSPNKEGTEHIHGGPLGDDEIKKTREKLKWKYKAFHIPKKIYEKFNFIENGEKLEKEWNLKLEEYKKKYPVDYCEYTRRISSELPKCYLEEVKKLIRDEKKINSIGLSTRKASLEVLESFGPILSELIGGSADLSISNSTLWSGCIPFNCNLLDKKSNYIHYGVREFGMSAIMIGISLYGGFIPYGGTFLAFYNYSSPAIRMAAIMNAKCMFVFTHDSIGVGEDGPTHQPVEQIAALRATPNLMVWRPCDYIETVVAWDYFLSKYNGPSVIILSRQKLIGQKRNKKQIMEIYRGGYVLSYEAKKINPDCVIIATGSEIELAKKATYILNKMNYNIRIISIPCFELFLKQSKEYRNSILLNDKNILTISIEASSDTVWYKLINCENKIFSMKTFGKSGTAEQLFNEYGFTPEKIAKKIKNLIIDNEDNKKNEGKNSY